MKKPLPIDPQISEAKSVEESNMAAAQDLAAFGGGWLRQPFMSARRPIKSPFLIHRSILSSFKTAHDVKFELD